MCIICLWQSEYPKYTPLLAKILEALISRSNVKDKIRHDEEVSYQAYNQRACDILLLLLIDGVTDKKKY